MMLACTHSMPGHIQPARYWHNKFSASLKKNVWKKPQNTGNLTLCINWFLRSEYNTVKLMILVDLYFHWKVTNTAYTEILSKVIHLVDLTMSHLLKMLTSNKNACWYCLTDIILTSCLCILVKSWFERNPPPPFTPFPKI